MPRARIKRVADKLRGAAGHYDSSLPRMLLRAARLKLGHRINLDRALSLGLLDPQLTGEDLGDQISLPEFFDVLRRFNRDSDWALLDKTTFYGYCRGLGLPTPELYAVLSGAVAWAPGGDSAGTDAEWEALSQRVLPDEFIVKPAVSDYGLGVEAVIREGGGFQSTSGERFANAVELRRALVKDGATTIVQERLRCHPDLETLTGHPTAQTLRLVTVVDRDGRVRTWSASLRLVRSGGVVDNFKKGASGNILAVLDTDSGEVKEAFTSTPARIGLVPVDAHPYTGKPFAQFVAPHYQQAVALGHRAARMFLPLRAIGWDIAATARGPVLIEGNSVWGDIAPGAPYFKRADLDRLVALL